MYDFVKMAMNNQDFVNELLNNISLNFECPVNLKTGEINKLVQTATYKNLTFTIYPSNRVEIKGSLHKYWNDGEHNYNDYNLNAVTDTIADLKQKFNIEPKLASLHNLEVGLNIVTPFKPNNLLNSLIAFKNTPFNKMRIKRPGKGKDVYFQQFGVKFYNKGLQYFQPYNILRFEKKYLKMVCLGRGQVFLSDLLSPDFAAHCINELLNCFDEIIIKETVNNALLSKNENRIYEFCNNPLHWETMTRKQRYKYKSQFAEIIQSYGQERFKTTIRELLLHKGDEIIKCS
jgi:hypothetical protein